MILKAASEEPALFLFDIFLLWIDILFRSQLCGQVEHMNFQHQRKSPLQKIEIFVDEISQKSESGLFAKNQSGADDGRERENKTVQICSFKSPPIIQSSSSSCLFYQSPINHEDSIIIN